MTKQKKVGSMQKERSMPLLAYLNSGLTYDPNNEREASKISGHVLLTVKLYLEELDAAWTQWTKAWACILENDTIATPLLGQLTGGMAQSLVDTQTARLHDYVVSEYLEACLSLPLYSKISNSDLKEEWDREWLSRAPDSLYDRWVRNCNDLLYLDKIRLRMGVSAEPKEDGETPKEEPAGSDSKSFFADG